MLFQTIFLLVQLGIENSLLFIIATVSSLTINKKRTIYSWLWPLQQCLDWSQTSSWLFEQNSKTFSNFLQCTNVITKTQKLCIFYAKGKFFLELLCESFYYSKNCNWIKKNIYKYFNKFFLQDWRLMIIKSKPSILPWNMTVYFLHKRTIVIQPWLIWEIRSSPFDFVTKKKKAYSNH